MALDLVVSGCSQEFLCLGLKGDKVFIKHPAWSGLQGSHVYICKKRKYLLTHSLSLELDATGRCHKWLFKGVLINILGVGVAARKLPQLVMPSYNSKTTGNGDHLLTLFVKLLEGQQNCKQAAVLNRPTPK